MNIFLGIIDFIELIPAWIEALFLVGSSIGGTLGFLQILKDRSEQKRRQEIEKLDSIQKQIANGYAALLEEFREARKEDANRIEELEKENTEKEKKIIRLERRCSKGEVLREGYQTAIAFLLDKDSMPPDAAEYLMKSPLLGRFVRKGNLGVALREIESIDSEIDKNKDDDSCC